MGCNTCGHAHTRTEQTVRYTFATQSYVTFTCVCCKDENAVEETLMICSAAGCLCSELDPTDYEDRLALIAAGEIDE